MIEKKDNLVENEKRSEAENKKSVLGYLLIIFGVVFLFERIFRFSFFGYIAWRYIWPFLLVVLGIYLVTRKNK